MINNFLDFLLYLFYFFDFLNKRKVIFINLRRPLLDSNFRHPLFKLLIIDITHWVSLSLRLVTDYTSLWYFWHKWTVRIDLLLYLNFFNDNLLFNDWFWWNKIFARMWIVNRKDFSCYEWISIIFIV